MLCDHIGEPFQYHVELVPLFNLRSLVVLESFFYSYAYHTSTCDSSSPSYHCSDPMTMVLDTLPKFQHIMDSQPLVDEL